MKIAISGSTGFIGSRLKNELIKNNHDIIPITRREIALEPEVFSEYLQDVDIVINMAGANIAQRWNREYKKLLYTSRVHTTQKIVSAISLMDKRPKKFIQTSAVGIYDEVGEHTEEDFGYAVDFLGLICRDWEREAMRVQESGVDVIVFRFGVVLGKNGGVLSKMLPVFRLGIAGTIGKGSQPFSWIHIDDLIAAYMRVVTDDGFNGIYNLTAPNPITNKELTKTLGKILHRPTLFPLPEFILKIIYGEGADVLTVGQRVLPKRLMDSGFEFRFSKIDDALKDILEVTA